MAESLGDLRSPAHFCPDGEASSVSIRWKAWKDEFGLYADCKGMFNDKPTPDTTRAETCRRKRRALFLYCLGPKVREIFNGLEDKGDSDDFDLAVRCLDQHFNITPNKIYLKHVFRKMAQTTGETISQYVARLRTASEGCGFPDVNVEIVDQVVSNCYSGELRTKFLREGDALDLTRLQEISATFEAVEIQSREMSNSSATQNPTFTVNKTQSTPVLDPKMADITCYRCGYKGHKGNNPACPAKGKTCSKCEGKDHFASRCRSSGSTGKKQSKADKRANCVEANTDSPSDSENSYAFNCKSSGKFHRFDLELGGVKANFIVDSACDTNLLGRDLWESLKAEKIQCVSRKTSDGKGKHIYPYASDKPLDVLGTFEADVNVAGRKTRGEFTVVDHNVEPLLSCETSEKLGLLKIGLGVNSCSRYDGEYNNLVHEFKEIFSGIGLLKDREVKLNIDEKVNPVIQPYRRIPFGLRSKVEDKLRDLIAKDIIEPVPVDEVSSFVSPVVVAPKPNGDIRLCLDMRQANAAIVRERHPIPTIEEMLLDMSKSNVFSKLDLKWGFHQLLLHPDSRSITTFTTHVGLFRYKRLLFGVSSAPEIYQNEIRKVIQGIPGVANMSDDLVVHGKDKSEHDKRLRQVFERLRRNGLTLNQDKSVFGVDEIEFLGHKLSKGGVDPGLGKIDSVLSFKQPKDCDEVRSFLGLVNYLGRFIPNLADLSGPLRKMINKKGADFEFGRSQIQAFDALKKVLVSHETLGYFDVDAETRLITDASPIGLGAVLVQMHDGTPRAISYASRSLTDVETRYSQTEKEGLAIVWACEKFQAYLIGKRFTLMTDHRPLLNIYYKRSKPQARLERWVLRLQSYDFDIQYVEGKNNIADPLSRLINRGKGIVDKMHFEDMAFVRFVAHNATPRAVTTRMIERESDADPELCEVMKCLQYGNWSNFTGPPIYHTIKGELCVVGRLLLRGHRIVVPQKLRSRMVALAHEGHLGIVGTKQAIRTKLFWPGMDREVESYCKSCHGCQITSKVPSPEPIRTTKLPSSPWTDLAIDHMGPLPSGEHVLVVVDYYSRWFEIAFMKSTTAENTIKELDKMFFIHGLPKSMKSDNAAVFRSEVFKDYCDHLGIDHYRVIPKWPQANGEVERQNGSLGKRIEIAYAERGDYKSEIYKFMMSYRANVHPATGKSPAEMLYGRRIRTKIPHISDNVDDIEARDNDAEYKAKSKVYVDNRRGATHSDLVAGDVVLMRNERSGKGEPNFCPRPGTIVERRGPSVTVETADGRRFDRNISTVKRYYTSSPSVVGAGSEEEGRDGEMLGAGANDIHSDAAEFAPQPSANELNQVGDELLMNDQTHHNNSTPVRVSDRPARMTKRPAWWKDYHFHK